MNLVTIIGLEVHVELKTNSKISSAIQQNFERSQIHKTSGN